MAMGIVICMAVVYIVSVHIHSVLTLPKHPAVCASNMAIKRNAARTDAQTMTSGRGFAKIMLQLH
jgi:uncharacterized protein HemY